MQSLDFPSSLPEFQKLFPDDQACVDYLIQVHYPEGFQCKCGSINQPYRFANRPHVLRCRSCKNDVSLTANTVMERTRTPLSTWFWGAYLLTSMTPGMSAVQFQRQLGLKRYETAFQILHKLRAGMVRPNRDLIGARNGDHVEVDEVWIGGRTRGEGQGKHHKTLVVGAVEVRQRKPKETDHGNPYSKAIPRRGGRYAGRLRLAVVDNRTAKELTSFVQNTVESGAMIVTDDWASYDKLEQHGYAHLQVAEKGNSKVIEDYLPIIHLIFSNLKAWLSGVHHGVGGQHLQAYLNEFVFRFNRRFYPFNAFRSLLGVAAGVAGPTYSGIYNHTWEHPSVG